MDYGFCEADLKKQGKCESCESEADHVMILVEKLMIGIFQICYECSVMVEFGGKDYRFIPKKNAQRRNDKCTALCSPRT